MSVIESRPRAPSRAAIRANFQRHALIPKLKGLSTEQLFGVDISRRATLDELHLLSWIADNADALVVEGKIYAVVPLPGRMVDKLASIGARLADLELEDDDLCHHDDPREDSGDTEEAVGCPPGILARKRAAIAQRHNRRRA